MFRWLIGSSLKYRFVLLAASVALVVFGTEQLQKMPLDAFPPFSPPKVEIQTVGPGMSASEVEQLISIPMERTLSGTPDLVKIISMSVTQLSVLQLTFKRGVDLFEKRQQVQELMNVAFSELAHNTGVPVMLSPSGATKRVMKIGVSSDKYSLLDLSMIAYWTLKFRLMTVPGVANIPIAARSRPKQACRCGARRRGSPGIFFQARPARYGHATGSSTSGRSGARTGNTPRRGNAGNKDRTPSDRKPRRRTGRTCA